MVLEEEWLGCDQGKFSVYGVFAFSTFVYGWAQLKRELKLPKEILDFLWNSSGILFYFFDTICSNRNLNWRPHSAGDNYSTTNNCIYTKGG